MGRLNLLLGLVLLAFSASSSAQLVNNGVVLSMDNGAVLYVDHNYVHNDGIVLNNGDIYIKNDWFNNSTTNKVFDVGSMGKVSFFGSSQRITGGAVTQFPNLIFAGVGTISFKRDVEVRLSLNLTSKEIITEGNGLYMLSTLPSDLMYTTGFINTSGGGFLSRSTAKSEGYYFPFGSSADKLSRPLIITPKDNLSNVFSASLEVKDPTLDGYSRLSKRNDVSQVNDKYYFKLGQKLGVSSAEIAFFTIQKEGDYNWIIDWVDNRTWQKAALVKVQDGLSSISGYDRVLTMTTTGPLASTALPYNLANVSNATNPLSIFNAFSPDGDGKNDTWEIKNIDAFPDNEVKVFDRSGNLIYRMEGYTKAKAWDGQNVASGTYFYIVRVNINGEDKHYKGAITVVKK